MTELPGDTSQPRRADDDRRGPDAFVHREILQIGALIVIAVVAFIVTRAVAANSRQTTFRDAEAWYEQGQRLMVDGRLDEAIASFRRASGRNRDERKYALTLANALERNGDTEAARAALLMLREASPENVDVNLALRALSRSAISFNTLRAARTLLGPTRSSASVTAFSTVPRVGRVWTAALGLSRSCARLVSDGSHSRSSSPRASSRWSTPVIVLGCNRTISRTPVSTGSSRLLVVGSMRVRSPRLDPVL